jgi:hypothetical protein
MKNLMTERELTMFGMSIEAVHKQLNVAKFILSEMMQSKEVA